MWASLEYPNADVRCYGFGSPKVGNRACCRAVNFLIGHTIRVVHGHDPIPLLPGKRL